MRPPLWIRGRGAETSNATVAASTGGARSTIAARETMDRPLQHQVNTATMPESELRANKLARSTRDATLHLSCREGLYHSARRTTERTSSECPWRACGQELDACSFPLNGIVVESSLTRIYARCGHQYRHCS